MRILQLALVALMAGMLCGCRGGGDVALLERELRLQEDKMYALEDALDQCEAMLDASRRENEALKRELATGDRGAAPGTLPSPPRGVGSPSDSGPKIEGPSIEGPTIEGAPLGPALDGAGAAGPSFDGGAPGDAPSALGSILRGTDSADENPEDTRITQIVLNPRLTGGRSHDGQPGDEGVMVAFEPRNAAGQLVKEPGEVSIVVLDPSKTGAAARIARWDFTPDEALAHYKKTAIARGLQFELPWPSKLPMSDELHLFVRFITSDGRKLQADMQIHADLVGGSKSGHWSTVAQPAPSDGFKPVARPARDVAPRQLDRSAGDSATVANESATSQNSRPGVARALPPAPRRASRGQRPGWTPNR